MMKEPILETRLTQKGQVTIPQALRELLGLKPKDRIRFQLEGDKVFIVRAPSRVARNFGALASPIPALDPREEREAYEKGVADHVSHSG